MKFFKRHLLSLLSAMSTRISGRDLRVVERTPMYLGVSFSGCRKTEEEGFQLFITDCKQYVFHCYLHLA